MVPNLLRSSRTSRTLLAFLLVVAEPAGLALVASGLVATIGNRGGLAVAWLVVRLLITGFGVGVGMALWHERPGATSLTRWAVGLAFAATMITALTPIWPHPLPPGVREPATALLLAWYGALFVWTVRTTSSERRATSSERGATNDEL